MSTLKTEKVTEIECTKCENTQMVYHLDWPIHRCTGCGRLVVKADWIIKDTTTIGDTP